MHIRDGWSDVGNPPLHVAINAQLVSFSRSYRSAGVSRYIYTLLAGLSELSTNQHYTAFVNAGEAAAARESPLGKNRERLELVPAGARSRSPIQRIWWEQLLLQGELKRRGVQVFHSPVNVLPGRLHCACVVTVHDLAFIRYPQYFRATRRIYQRLFTGQSVRRATRIIAVSEATKQDLVDAFHLAPEVIEVVYPVVDEDFQPCLDEERLREFRARHRLPDRYILFVGTLEPRKNITGLLEAYARLRRREADAPQLVLAGGQGWYFGAIFERVRALALEPYITFAGYVSRDELPLWYAASELFVYPSLYEGFGIPVAEALACGTPAITSNVSSLPEAGGPVAVLVNPRDAEALACAMQSSLASGTARPRALADGPKWTERFSRLRAAEASARIYRDAAYACRQEATGPLGKVVRWI
ncbi:MAG: glycosyltransferase family 4 protein [Ktedonobacterales bacterium]